MKEKINGSYKLKLPEYTKSLPSNVSFNTAEVAGFFGFKSSCSVTALWVRELFPPPDSVISKGNESSLSRLYWQLETLREHESEQGLNNEI